MRLRKLHLTLLVALTGSLLGCETQMNYGGPDFAPVIGVQQLAGHLGMQVVESRNAQATLRNSGNTVLLFGRPGAGAYVNGKPLGDAGIGGDGRQILVSKDLAESIREELRSGPTLAQRTPRQTRMRPRVRPRPEPPVRSTVDGTVVLDAGHGGRDPGAMGCVKIGGNDICEKDVNLAVTLETARLLRAKGVNVILTRDDDTYVDLDERVEIGNRRGVDLFVSIHADWCGTPSVNGFHALIPGDANGEDKAAARAIIASMTTSGANNRGMRHDSRGLRVLRKATVPAVLVEMGFLSNAGEARLLANDAHRRKLAAGIAEGVIDYLQR